jgi:hypothetical protein
MRHCSIKTWVMPSRRRNATCGGPRVAEQQSKICFQVGGW